MKCMGCRCTEYRACIGGCSWLNVNPPKCSACVETGVLSLLDNLVHRVPVSFARRGEGELVLQGRRFICQ